MHHGEIDKRTAKGLLALQERIKRAKIPSSKLDETLNVATWNVRELGKKKRLKTSLHLIAEIIGQFDLVTLVELRDDTSDFSEVIRYLGPYWDVVYSDYVADPGGNRERQAFVFDFYEGNHRPLFPGKRMDKTAFTYQLSDHLPLWVQLNTDNDKEKLEQILNMKQGK